MGPAKLRSRSRRLWITLWYCLCGSSLATLIASTALAGPIELQINPLSSYANVELCQTAGITACDTDTTSIAGSVVVSLDYPPGPSGISLHDFTFQLVEDVTLSLVFPPSDQFDSIGRGIDLAYAAAGSPLPSVPVVLGAFNLAGVPTDLTGQLEYMATGSVCTELGSGGYPCDGVVDLSTSTLDLLDMNGTVAVSGSDVALTLGLVLTGSIYPTISGFDKLTIDGTVSAVGVIPEPSTLLLLGLGCVGVLCCRWRTATLSGPGHRIALSEGPHSARWPGGIGGCLPRGLANGRYCLAHDEYASIEDVSPGKSRLSRG